jgi:hypothetical protein
MASTKVVVRPGIRKKVRSQHLKPLQKLRSNHLKKMPSREQKNEKFAVWTGGLVIRQGRSLDWGVLLQYLDVLAIVRLPQQSLPSAELCEAPDGRIDTILSCWEAAPWQTIVWGQTSDSKYYNSYPPPTCPRDLLLWETAVRMGGCLRPGDPLDKAGVPPNRTVSGQGGR